MIVTQRFSLSTRGGGQVILINDEVARYVAASKVKAGIVTLFVTGTTAGVCIMEHEPGLVEDMNAAMERLIPQGIVYQHNVRNNDDNGHSHTRAVLMGPSVVIPVADGKPMLGTWQRVVLVDFDSRPRKRDLVVQVMGE
ncbi:MAG: YjbQ family protein [Chloroflexi bacterium]|nr:YjbQ family protein [Chloroflexota bacterium]